MLCSKTCPPKILCSKPLHLLLEHKICTCLWFVRSGWCYTHATIAWLVTLFFESLFTLVFSVDHWTRRLGLEFFSGMISQSAAWILSIPSFHLLCAAPQVNGNVVIGCWSSAWILSSPFSQLDVGGPWVMCLIATKIGRDGWMCQFVCACLPTFCCSLAGLVQITCTKAPKLQKRVD
jgi:hypothetical protein